MKRIGSFVVGLGLAVACVVVIVACPEHDEDRRAELIGDVVEAQLIPDLTEASERGETLRARAQALCSQPDPAQLDAVQDA